MTALSDLTFNEQFTLKVRHPITGEPLLNGMGEEWEIVLWSMDTPAYVSATSDTVGVEMTPPERVAAILAGCVVSWTVQVDPDEDVAPVDRAAEAFIAHKWLREAVDRAVHDRANFFIDASES